MLRHHGKVAIVTGGSSGIGRAIVRRLASEGADVAIADIADGSESVAEAQSAGGKAYWVRCDLTDEAAIRSCTKLVAERSGAASIFVHSAAVQFVRPFADLTPEDWRLTQRVNQESVFHFVQTLLPGMRAAAWGRLILITSSTFFINPSHMTHYVTSKGALMGFSHGLAGEVGQYGITINCVAPGLTRTAKAAASLPEGFFQEMASLQAIKRSGTPDDQSGVVSFLASDDAAFITGQTILADGGQART
ncbi:MAG TPA: SDR family oxidoreductase [Steroidobacteraceae bacterium]|nr:SDR family oxidoreductase [Steroidobacteraceae bacterium]